VRPNEHIYHTQLKLSYSEEYKIEEVQLQRTTEVVEQNLMRRQGSACNETSPPSSTDQPSESSSRPSSSSPTPHVTSFLLLAEFVIFRPNVTIMQRKDIYN
jgi:hypothetical protein